METVSGLIATRRFVKSKSLIFVNFELLTLSVRIPIDPCDNHQSTRIKLSMTPLSTMAKKHRHNTTFW